MNLDMIFQGAGLVATLLVPYVMWRMKQREEQLANLEEQIVVQGLKSLKLEERLRALDEHTKVELTRLADSVDKLEGMIREYLRDEHRRLEEIVERVFLRHRP